MVKRTARKPRTAISARRLVVVPFDFFAWFTAVFMAVVLRFEFRLEAVSILSTTILALALAASALGVGFVNHLYRNRYVVGSLEELRALVTTVLTIGLTIGLLVVFLGNSWGLPRSVVFIAAPIFLLLSGGLRAYLRFWRLRENSPLAISKRALIYGAGDAAEALIPQLLGTSGSPYLPVVLLDDAPEKGNRWIRGVPMGGRWKDLVGVAEKYRADVVIVAIPSATSELLSRVYSDASKLGLQVIVLPTLREYLGGRTTSGELRNVSIEDLIGRQSVELDSALVLRFLEGKKVLVTGAGGSIGSELVRQIAGFQPSTITLVDRDETALLLASLGAEAAGPKVSHETYLVDIRDKEAVGELFVRHQPDVVFHAAALKHLSALERFPREGWKTNVEGSLNVLEAARESRVSAFVNISTDKAANPANILGKSKRLAEELTGWFASQAGKTYVSVRFGNVLGSRGSLIPILAQQIGAGGPLTITDKNATRYFMSIPEACQLVLQAAAEGEGGDVLVLDMGEPVRIQDIAERMIELSGRSIDIVYTGLRPGEKLHEDLISDLETPIPSSHPKIMRVKATPRSPEEVLAEKW